MMVKPADADGDVEMDAHASTDAVNPHAAAVRETSQEEEEEEEDAMAALLGVGREIGSSGDGADGDDRGANAPEPAAGPGAHGEADDEDMDEDEDADEAEDEATDDEEEKGCSHVLRPHNLAVVGAGLLVFTEVARRDPRPV